MKETDLTQRFGFCIILCFKNYCSKIGPKKKIWFSIKWFFHSQKNNERKSQCQKSPLLMAHFCFTFALNPIREVFRCELVCPHFTATLFLTWYNVSMPHQPHFDCFEEPLAVFIVSFSASQNKNWFDRIFYEKGFWLQSLP